MERTRPTLSRRTFLLAAGAGTAATAAAIVGHKAPAREAAPDSGPSQTSGYRETAHVRNYYRTARI